MTYPTKYSRLYDFASYQNANPTRPLPGDRVNFDLNAIKQSVTEIVDFLKGPIRSDGKLMNKTVGRDQLADNVNLGFDAPTDWAPATIYTLANTVFHGNIFYKANTNHTSGDTFDASKWDVIADFSVAVTAAAASADAAAASETSAAASEMNAAASETNATADAVATAADRVQTGLDKTAAQAAQTAAESARDVALGATAIFPTKALAEAFAPVAGPAFIQLQGHTSAGVGQSLYRKVGAEPSHPGKLSITLSDAVTVVWYEIAEKRLDPLMFGAVRDQAGVDSWQAFKDCIDTIAAQATAAEFRYGGPLYVPAGQYEISKQFDITTPGVRLIGEGGTTSVITAQAGFVGSYIITHQPPSGDTTTLMTGVGVIGIGLDCNEQAIHGYLGEMVYDGVVYDDFRIDRPGASAIGFQLKPRAGNAITVCQTIDIRSLFVGKYTVKGTAPAVLLDNCQEINIWSSKAWNGYGADDTNKGTAAAWFFQDCRTVTMVGCSAAGSMYAGVAVYANTRSCDGIALVNPLFENLDGANVLVDSSNYASYSVRDLSIINPRHETPVAGYNLLATNRAYVEVGPQSVNLGTNSTLTTVLADDLSQVADSGTNNMIRSRSNAVNAWEGFGHDINVKPGGVTRLKTRAPASGETSILVTVNEAGTIIEKVVLEGAPDSGGTGFRALRTVN